MTPENPDPREHRAIDALLFDFGGVLAEEGFREGLKAIGRRSGVPPEDMAAAGFELVHRTGYVTGRADEAAFWRALRDEVGTRGADQALRREILARFVIRPWMLDLVDRLRARGRTVGLLSDQTQWLDEIDRDQSLFSHFDHVLNSFHTGVSKRDPRCFDLAVERIGHPADRVLFVDDHDGNVIRARERGLHATRYEDRGSFLRALFRWVPDAVPPPDL